MGAGSGPSEPEGVKTNSKEVNKSKYLAEQTLTIL